jgi:hypothetical protein
MEGVTHVSMSQQMLQSIFARPKNPQESPHAHDLWMTYKELNIPEAYSSILVSKTDNSSNMFADFKKTLLSSNYEQFLELKKENSDVLVYYIKKVNNNPSEIVVVSQQKNQFSVIYIKGKIEMRQVDDYLRVIKLSLVRMGAINQIRTFASGHQYTYAMSLSDDFKTDFSVNFKFDKDVLEEAKLRMEESKRKMEESKNKIEEDAKRNLEQYESISEEKNVEEQVEDINE